MLLLRLKDLYPKALTVMTVFNRNAVSAQIPLSYLHTHTQRWTHTRMAEICEPFFSVTVSDAWHILTPEVDQCRYVQREIEIHRKLGGASDLLE